MVKDKDIGRPLSDHRSLEVAFHPNVTSTVATVTLAWRDERGANRSRVARWHLRVSRSDLAGHSSDDVIRGLVDGLLRRLESGRDPADWPWPIGTGSPLGDTGGTVTQDTLPGL